MDIVTRGGHVIITITGNYISRYDNIFQRKTIHYFMNDTYLLKSIFFSINIADNLLFLLINLYFFIKQRNKLFIMGPQK